MKNTAKYALHLLLFMTAASGLDAQAAETDISNSPMASSSNTSIKPNVYFILDNSGSMNWDYLPDSVNSNNSKFCYRNHNYNGVYYNPNLPYTLPVYSTGASLANANFSAAKVDGFSASSSTTDLNISFSTGNDSGGKTAYYYEYTGTSPATPVRGTCYSDSSYTKRTISSAPITTITVSGSSSAVISGITVNGVQIMSGSTSSSSTDSTVASRIAAKITLNGFAASSSGNTITIVGPNSAAGYTPAAPTLSSGSATFVRVAFSAVPNATQLAAAQNYANWYSYYRNRILSMKSAAGLAFKNLGDSYRVGFSTISYTGVDSADAGFLKIADFDTTHKLDWYNKLYGASGSGYTPLRGALSKAGRIYAGMLLTGADDPVQYSCQQNFTILSTDGYWNTNAESTSTPKYGPYGMDNATLVGQQDGAGTARPMNDGESSLKSTSQITETKTQVSSNTSQLQKRVEQIQSRTSTLQSQTSQLQAQTSTLQTQTSQLQTRTSQLQTRTSADSGSTWTAWSNVSTCTLDTTGSSRRACQYTAFSAWASTPSCSAVAKDTTNPYDMTASGGVARECQTVITSPYANTASCTVTTVPDGSGNTTQCQYTNWTAWANASSCTALARSASSPYTVGTATQCQYNDGTWVNAGSCTLVAKSAGSPYTVGTATQCQYTSWTAWANASSCTAAAQSGSSPYTVGTATGCQTTDTGFVGASSCTPGITGGQTTTCQTITTGPTLVASCTPAAAASGNSWTQTTCTPTTVQAATGVLSCTAEDPVAGNSFTTTSCNTVTTGPAAVSTCTAETKSALNDYTAITCGAGPGGISNTLADVAMYYYKNDLRTSPSCTGALGAGVDVCENNVPGSGSDVNTQQHMTTFTLGLGVDGTLGYADNYLSGGSADYEAIKQGTKNWPDPIVNSGAERIDDLWHAAVNGHGQYYSAGDPNSLVNGLSGALAGVTARSGSAAAAATSNLEPVAGDNYLFIALFRTVYWDGDLQARTIDPATGAITATATWTAQPQLDLRVNASSDTRTIYTYDASNANGNHLMAFNWANVGGTGYFDNICSPTAKLSQCPTLISNDATNGTTTATDASGANLVNFLRGQYGNEATIYRDREHVLGDMVNSQPMFVKAPPFSYVDTNYSAFKAAQANRSPRVYVAANDGMLHAFNGESGHEEWAYIPPMLMSNLYHLADMNYSVNHRYYVDGSPAVADICPNAPTSTCTSEEWKTIVVGGFNAGGKGYYALDITNPAAPKALWNFTTAQDADLGYSFGNPIVTKRKDGTWIAAVTSGYNNVSGDGRGYLYILNANTGELLEKIGTGVGSATSPSGLAKINVWVNEETDNTAQRFYGGDLLGNLWRFTLDSGTPPAGPVSTNGTAVLLAELGGINGAGVQPITTKPELTLVPYNGIDYVVVYVSTGRYLGQTDLANTDKQTVYAIKDTLSGTGLGHVRTNGVLVQQIMSNFTGTGGEQLRSITNIPVSWSNTSGWYVDLDPGNSSPGERVNVDMELQLGVLKVVGNVPSNNACNIGGYSFMYDFDFKSGQQLATAVQNAIGKRLPSNAMVVGMNTIRLQSGQIITILTDSGGGVSSSAGSSGTTSSGTARRVSWRELIQ